MKFRRKKVAVAVACALALGTGAATLCATAQAQDVTAPAQDVIKIRVVGSNIPVISGEAALPIQVIDRVSIEREGIQNAAQLLDRISSNSTTGSVTIASTEGNSNAGFSAASLRGLGAQRTLVLLNGRRVTNNAFSNAGVDLNTIPLSAIERVEILTDGASAVYGSDAIAGVINFILRKDYQGAEASAYYGDSQHGGGWVQHYTGTAGFGDLQNNKFNVFVSADYQQLGALKAVERPFSRSAVVPSLGIDKTSGNTIPANVATPVGTRNPGNPACLPPFSFPTDSSPLQCRFDYASVIDILPPQELTNVVGRATWQFSTNNQAFLEANWANSKVTSRVSPMPVSRATTLDNTPILIPPTSPFYPHAFAQQFGLDGQPLEVAWRSLELGPRAETDEVKQSRVVAGVQGVAWGWDYNGAVLWNENRSTSAFPSGWAQVSVLQPLLNSGQINVFGFNTGPALALLQGATFHGQLADSKGTVKGIDFHASNDVWQLPAGWLALALGAEYHKEEYQVTPSAIAQSGDLFGFGSSIALLPTVSRNVKAVFAEANIPIVQTLEGNLAVRYDRYSDFGGTTNPKASLRWQPVKQVLVRASWGTGFRAPGLPELFVPTSLSSTGENHDDPVRCPVTHSSFDCQTQFNSLLGGNPNLKPEKSTQYGLGAVWEPVPGSSAGLDYWKIDVKDVVGQLGEATIFDNFARSEAQGLVVRFPPSAGDPPGLPGRIQYIIQTNQNIQKLRVEGVDVNLTYLFPPLDWGQFSGSLHGSYYIKWEQADTNTGEMINYAGQSTGGIATVNAGVGFPAALPRWKHNASLTWTYGPWAATLTQLFQNSYKDDSGTREVGTYTLWDISGSYTGFKNVTLSAGVKNLVDRPPPASDQGEAFQVGYDPTYADPRGRFFWGMVKVSYK